MGYRTYIGQLSKSLADQIHKCVCQEDLVQVLDNNVIEIKNVDYTPVYEICTELYEFGGLCPAAEDIYGKNSTAEPLYSTQLEKEYSDYGAVIINEDILLKIINWYRDNIISYYENLTSENYKDEFHHSRTQFQALLDMADNHLFWWKIFGAIDLDKSNDNVNRSYAFEYTIFDLVRIYKSFDWENNVMIFYGW